MNTISGIFMNKDESIKYQIITKYLHGKLHRDKAARLLNVSERTVTRYAQKIKRKGVFGVKHGNWGNSFNQKYSRKFIETIVNLYQEKYFDFNLSHFSEVLKSDYDIEIPYATLWRWFKSLKLIKKPRRKRPRKHVYRTRMPQEGLLLQMDGSHHKFNGKDTWCLIAAIDDATSDIPYAEFFGDGETTINCMKVLKQIILKRGVPKAIYTDKAGWAGGGKRTEFSQFKRACEKLGIQVIFADSPEAKGRIERTFRTIQDRIIPEFRLHKIKTLKKANEYLNDEFIGKYWKDTKVIKPEDKESAYSPIDPWVSLDSALVIEEDRVIARDQTVCWKGKKYLLVDGQHSIAGYRAVFRTNLEGEVSVTVHERSVEMKPIEQVPLRERMPSVAKIELDPKAYIKMHRLVIELNNAVKRHRVLGGALKVGKRAS